MFIAFVGSTSRYGHKGEVDLKWANMAEQIHTEYDLLQIMAFIENSSTCSGVSSDKYSELITDKSVPVYHTRDGYPAAFVEIPKSELSLPLILSSNCSILLLERSDVIDVPTTCKSCKLTKNYLRTIKSTRNKTNESGSTFSTFESKSKEELIEIARQFSGRLKVLKLSYFEEKGEKRGRLVSLFHKFELLTAITLLTYN